MESSLFTAQSVGRLLDCTTAVSAFKTLVDMGFGAGASVAEGNFDAVFAVEETRAVEFLKEFNVDGALDVFLAKYDFLNLKSCAKSCVTRKKASPAPTGKYEPDEMKVWLDSDSKADVPSEFADVVTQLKQLLSGDGASPRKIDCAVDRAEYAYIFSTLKKSAKLERRYFTFKADCANVGAFLRCKRLGLPRAYFAEGFIEGGELDFLPAIYDASLDALKEKCKRTPYEELVTKAVDDGNLVAFEVAVDNALFKIFRDEKDDMFGIAPVVAFYLAKITQIHLCKLAVAGIKNGVDKDKIRERMRELYA